MPSIRPDVTPQESSEANYILQIFVHFTDTGTETQESEPTCPRSHAEEDTVGLNLVFYFYFLNLFFNGYTIFN